MHQDSRTPAAMTRSSPLRSDICSPLLSRAERAPLRVPRVDIPAAGGHIPHPTGCWGAGRRRSIGNRNLVLDGLECKTAVGVEVAVVEDPGVVGVVGVLDLEGRRYQRSEVGEKRQAR